MKSTKDKKNNIVSNGIYLLPNLITSAALFCGVYSITFSIKGENLPKAAVLIIFAAIFDFLDGYVARASKTTSNFGLEYDSLSDVISFGVAPAALYYASFLHDLKKIGVGAAFIIVACASLRLARFNSKIEGEEKVAFRGLPTTAAASFLASFFLVLDKYSIGIFYPFIPGIIVIVSFLMVSSIKYPAINAARLWRKKSFFYFGTVIIMIGLSFFYTEICFFMMTFTYLLSALK